MFGNRRWCGVSSEATDIVESWVGAYYPSELVSEPRARTVLCLLFDKVVCHFPVADMACGGGIGMSEELSGDDPLVEAGVIELREEFLLDLPSDVDVQFSDGHWGTEEEFARFVRLQVTAMAMGICASEGAVPVTDDPAWPVPAAIAGAIDLARFARLQAAALGLHSVNIAIPPMAAAGDDEILEAREQLREQLIPFRRSMLRLAPAVREAMRSGASMSDVAEEARYVVETLVAPSLSELHDRVAVERRRLLEEADR